MNHKNSNPDIREQAFLLLWDKIYESIYRMTSDEKESEDIAMNSFAKLMKRKDIDSMSLGHIEAFLRLTARNETIDTHRKSKTWRKILQSIAHKTPASYEEDWYCKDMVAEYGDVLKEVINELSDRRKEILMLKFYEGLSASEISEKLVISLNTVNNTLSKAYESTRIKLLERGIKF
jgi:RNA polymerase sigma-70 factor (ECF subfamily)